MLWPAAALAALVLGFVVVYASVLQSRLKAGFGIGTPDAATDAGPEGSAPAHLST
jgi:hypothetical protein